LPFGELGSGFFPEEHPGTFPEFTRFSFTGFPVMLPFDSPSLYQLSYRGSNCEEATANTIAPLAIFPVLH
jgi:hypothetical protein